MLWHWLERWLANMQQNELGQKQHRVKLEATTNEAENEESTSLDLKSPRDRTVTVCVT
jgi:hypothetical protein